MKKIQVSTIQQTADVQVISLNAYFIAKAIKAEVAMKNALKGNKKVSKDENGEEKITYSRYLNSEEDAQVLHEQILSFLEELCNAFEE